VFVPYVRYRLQNPMRIRVLIRVVHHFQRTPTTRGGHVLRWEMAPLRGPQSSERVESTARKVWEFRKPLRFRQPVPSDFFVHGLLGLAAPRVQVRARTHAEAADSVLDSMDLLRGMWNLAINKQIGFRFTLDS
jgi:hypothetical protein